MVKKPKKTPKKKPKKKPVKFFLPYALLVGDYPNWGSEFDDKKAYQEARKHPSHSELNLAFLTAIVRLLREIRDEIGQERSIK